MKGPDDFTEDRMALEVISRAVPPELMGPMANKDSAKEAWDALKLRNVGVDRVKKSKLTTLRSEFDSLKFHDGETIDEFTGRISRIADQVALYGKAYTEEEICRRFLQASPPKFDQIAAAIETLLDLSDVSVDELIGRLKAAEVRLAPSVGDSLHKLNLTEDELVARLSSRLKLAGSSNPGGSKEASSSKRGRGRGCGRGAGGRDGDGGGHGNRADGGKNSSNGGRGGGAAGRGGRDVSHPKF